MTAYELRIIYLSSYVCSSDLFVSKKGILAHICRTGRYVGSRWLVSLIQCRYRDCPWLGHTHGNRYCICHRHIIHLGQTGTHRLESVLKGTGSSEESRVGKEGVHMCSVRLSEAI